MKRALTRRTGSVAMVAAGVLAIGAGAAAFWSVAVGAMVAGGILLVLGLLLGWDA